MKTHIFTLLFLFACNLCQSQECRWEWSLQGGGSGWDHGYAIVTDNENNIIVRGKLVNTGYFGDTSIVAIGPEEDYLAKYTSEGKLLWVRKISGKASWEKDRSIATDEYNNIYLTGYFKKTYNFDHIQLSPKGEYDGYITKLNKDGDYIWAKALGGYANDAGYAITYVNTKLFVTGFFSDTVNFGSGEMISKGNEDIFVSCFDTSGSNLWSKSAGSVNDDRGYGIASDNNYVYITAQISGNATFNNTQLNSIGSNDFVLAKYDQEGKLIWAKNDASSGEIESKTIAVSEGNIYVTGFFSGSVNFGSFVLSATGQSDVYIAKYNENGFVDWVDMHSGTFANEGNSIAVKGQKVYMVGVYGHTINVGDTTLSTDASRNTYVCCYKTDGDFVWALESGANTGSNHVLGNTIAVDQSGFLYIAGEYMGGCRFGGADLVPRGSFDMFLFKIQDMAVSSSIAERTMDKSLTVYPNPNNGVFTIKSNNSDKYIIYDLHANEVSSSGESRVWHVDLSTDPAGVYILKSVSGNQTVKIIHTGTAK
jgi:hypothetical protein